MNNLVQIIYLAPERINLSDSCLFWATEPDEDYIRNLKDFGQTEPVLVMSDPEKKILVAGYKRVRALKVLDREILALEIPAGNAYSKGLTYLFSNQGQTLDQGKIILALRYFSSINNISEEVWKQLNINPGLRIQGLWQSWLTLPAPWDKLLAKGNICLECAEILEKSPPKDLETLYPFFAELSWSRNNSLNLLSWLAEKARMAHTDLSTIITDLELEKILQADLSPADKIKSILRIVFKARHPVLSGMKDNLTRRLRNISAGTEWRIEHKDEFESREIIISARIKTRQDLEKAITRLEHISKSGALDNWPIK